MMQLFITLFLVFILLSGYICQTITSRISLPSVTGKTLAARLAVTLPGRIRDNRLIYWQEV